MSFITEAGQFSLTGNVGGAILPVLDNISILGSGLITVTGDPVLGTLTISGGGVTGMTEHAMVVGNAAGGITSLAVATDGQIPIGSTGNDVVLSTLTAGNNIGITNAAGSITIKVNGTTDHALQIGNATGDLTSLAVGSTGVILQGVVGADPSWSTATYPSTVALGDVLVASAANVIGVVNDVTNAGYVLTANVGAAPSFQALPPTGVTLTADDTNTASGASLTIAGGTNIGTTADGVSTLTINLDDTITLTQVNATTFDTNVVAAGTTLSGTTWAADGTDANIGLTLTPKGTGDVTVTVGDVAISSGNLTLPTSSSTVGQIVVNGSTWAHSYGSNSIYLGWSAGNFTYTGTGQNIGIGNNALKSTIAGYRNVSIGYNSAPTLNNWSECVVIGAEAGKALSCNIGSATSNGSVVIGYNALNTAYGNGNCRNMVVIGKEACKYLQQNQEGSVVIGANAVKNGGAGSLSTIIGTYALTTYTGTGGANTIIGAYTCGSTNGTNTFNINTIIGYAAGQNLSVASNAITDNTFIGSSSANAMTSGSNLYNVFLGGNTGATITTGNIQNNTFLGYAAGNSYPATSVPTYCINIGSGCSGTGTESYVTRIGQATGANAQTSCFVGGIYGITPAGTINVALVDSNGQLGSVASLGVAQGGTGAATLTDHGILLGSGTGAITPTAVGATGTLLTGVTGADPTWTTATYPATVAKGDVLVASADNTVDIVAGATTAGYVLTANGVATAPTFQAPSAGGISWSIKTSDLNPMVVDNGYIANKAGLLTFTLPTTCAVGKVLRVTGMNTDVGWRIAQSANQIIHFGASTTTTGAAGYIESTQMHDSVELVCCVADLEFIVVSSVGNITIA